MLGAISPRPFVEGNAPGHGFNECMRLAHPVKARSQKPDKRARQPYMHLSLAQSLTLSSLLLNHCPTTSVQELRISRSLLEGPPTLHNHVVELLNTF